MRVTTSVDLPSSTEVRYATFDVRIKDEESPNNSSCVANLSEVFNETRNMMNTAYLIRCLALWVAVFAVGIESLMFHLTPNQRKCLKEEIHKDVLVTGEYTLSDVPGQTANLKVNCSRLLLICSMIFSAQFLIVTLPIV